MQGTDSSSFRANGAKSRREKAQKGQGMNQQPQPFTEAEITAIRAQTPGAAGRIHLDNAGSSLMPRPVLDRMTRHLALEAEVGGYVAEERMAAEREATRDALAALLGAARPEEVAFCASASEGLGKLIASVPLAAGEVVVTGYHEYVGNLLTILERCRRTGARMLVLPDRGDGQLDLDRLSRIIADERVGLIVLSHIASSSGVVHDVAAVGRLAQAAGIPFLLDAAQSCGQVPVDVRTIGCDMLVGTARKFLRGPRGVGFMWIADARLATLEPCYLVNNSGEIAPDGGVTLRRDAGLFEPWEKNMTALLGLGAALADRQRWGPARIMARTTALAASLRAALAERREIRLVDTGEASGAIITFQHARLAADEIKQRLEARGIAVQVSRALHTPFDLGRRGIEAAVRVSPHVYNTEDEITRFITALDRL